MGCPRQKFDQFFGHGSSKKRLKVQTLDRVDATKYCYQIRLKIELRHLYRALLK